MRVLVVDDNPDHRFLTQRALAPLHVEVVLAHNGEAALDAIRADPPDLVLLDIKMSGMDGFELLERVRGADATRELPVIMFSSSENARDKERATRLGADAFLTKPLDARAFAEVVRSTVALWTTRVSAKRRG